MSTFEVIRSSKVEPEPMFLFGRTLKEMAARAEHPVHEDADGNTILDSEMYMIDSEGIFLIKE